MQLMRAWTKKELREWKPCANRSVPEIGLFFSGKQIVQTWKIGFSWLLHGFFFFLF